MVSASWPLIVVVMLVLLNKHDFSMCVVCEFSIFSRPTQTTLHFTLLLRLLFF